MMKVCLGLGPLTRPGLEILSESLEVLSSNLLSNLIFAYDLNGPAQPWKIPDMAIVSKSDSVAPTCCISRYGEMW